MEPDGPARPYLTRLASGYYHRGIFRPRHPELHPRGAMEY